MGNERATRNTAMDALLKLKGLGITVSVILILLGICMFIRPLATDAIVIWILIIGLFIRGIEEIVAYCKMPKGCRDGFKLAVGIIWVFTCGMTILRACNAGFIITANLEMFVAVMIACGCLFSGIGRICSGNLVATLGGSKAMAIIGGILEILCAFVILSAPLMSLFTLTIVYGIYFLIMGISLLIRCASI